MSEDPKTFPIACHLPQVRVELIGANEVIKPTPRGSFRLPLFSTAPMSAIGPKRTCRKTQSVSLLGVKRT